MNLHTKISSDEDTHTSDDESGEVGHTRSSLWLGDTSVKVLVQTSHFLESKRGSEPPVVDVLSWRHGNVLPISPLQDKNIKENIVLIGRTLP